MDELKIKPCSKCGSKGELVKLLDAVAVRCTNENCRHLGHPYLLYNVWNDFWDTAPVNAIEAWNEEN